MNLHVVAYPDMKPADYELIQACRKAHNSLYPIISPHFTLVFSVSDMAAADFIAEVKKQTAGIAPIPFCMRGVTINKDSFSDNYDTFLVPDEGHSRIIKLHDSLYSGKLAPYHRLDVSYIPHISIANSTSVAYIKAITDEWNARELALHGTISVLDIVNYENREIRTVERVRLG